MKVQQLAGAALFAVVAIGLVSWSLLTTKREQNQQQEKVELEQKLPFLQVAGKIGGEKVGFLSDLEVIRILRERYRLEVKAAEIRVPGHDAYRHRGPGLPLACQPQERRAFPRPGA